MYLNHIEDIKNMYSNTDSEASAIIINFHTLTIISEEIQSITNVSVSPKGIRTILDLMVVVDERINDFEMVIGQTFKFHLD